MNYKISVVVPTYKRPGLLDRCLLALINQNFPPEDYEIIVVTDGPDAESEKTVSNGNRGNSHDIKFLSLPEKKGPAAARNLGWASASGRLILFTDDDCIPDPAWLNAYWSGYANEHLISFTGKVIVPVSPRPSDFERNTQGLENAEFITANCALTKRALEITGGFDEAFKMAWREDSDLEFKLLLNNIPIKKVHAALVTHPVRKAPWGISIKEPKKGLFNALLYKKHPHLYRKKIQARIAWNYIFIILSFIGIISSLLLKWQVPALVFSAVWLLLTLQFISKRLSGTSRSAAHIMEMIVTSLLIPFLSVYWQLYGAIKYRVIFL